MSEPPKKRQRRHLNYNKCQFCRNAKKACTPVEQTWPQKCQRCIELELECSENSRAGGAPTSMTIQPKNQAVDINKIRDLSLGLTWFARLKLYHKTSEMVWDPQERLFPGWRRWIRARQKNEFIEHQETFLLNEFFAEMVFSNNPLAAFVAQAFNISSTPFQGFPPGHPIPEAAGVKANHFWDNGDRHQSERLTTILGRDVPALPPLHYLLHLTKKTVPIWTFNAIFFRFASARDYLGRSLLHVTLDLGITSYAIDLIQVGIADTRDDWGRQVIPIACSQNSVAFVKRVLESTADYDVEDDLGRSALHYASSYGNEEIVRLLLERGANIHHEDGDGQVPISWATKHGHTTVVQLLLKNGAEAESRCGNGSLLTTAASQGHTGIVQALLNNGVRSLNQPALRKAAGAGHTGTVELLLRYGGTIDGANFKGETALIYASRNGHANVVETLLKNGASINEENMYGETALIYASRNRHVDVVELLLKHGAGSTALSHA
ncbi:ankyrin repeat-containing domain protein [Xylaria sp. FL0064]|nr:ankyrin repeat-containing domain protein [Xylaria sp. FL0064]